MLATSREPLRVAGEVAWRVPSLRCLPGPRSAAIERSEAVRLFVERAADADAGLRAERGQRDGGRRDLPPARRHAARDRAGGRARRRARARRRSPSGSTTRSRCSAAAAARAAAPADAARDARLEPRAARRARADAAPAARRLRRRLRRRGGRGRSATATRSTCSRGWSTSRSSRSSGRRGTATGCWRRCASDALETARARPASARAWRPRTASGTSSWPRQPTATSTGRRRDVARRRLDGRARQPAGGAASAIRRDPPAALRLAAALWWFWMARGYFVEGGRRLEEALAAAPGPDPERARALFCAAGIEVRIRHGSYERLVGHSGTRRWTSRGRRGDRRAVARALERHGLIMMGSFHVATGERAFARASSSACEIGDKPTQVAIKHAPGVLTACRGDNAAARRCSRECLELLDGDRGRARAAVLGVPHLARGAPGRSGGRTAVLLRGHVRAAALGLAHRGHRVRARQHRRSVAGGRRLRRGPRARSSARSALFREVGDEAREPASPLNALGNLARVTGEYEHGARLLHRGARAAARGTRPARDRDDACRRPGGARLCTRATRDGRGAGRRGVRGSSPAPTTAQAPSCCRSTSRHSSSTPAIRRVRTTCSRSVAKPEGHDLVRSRGWPAAVRAEAAIALGERDKRRAGAARRAEPGSARSGEDRGRAAMCARLRGAA